MRHFRRLLPVILTLALALSLIFAFACNACAKTYSVTFDSDGGTEIAVQSVTDGQKAVKPGDPFKANYEFDGWFLGEEKYDFDSAVTADITLKAHWTRLYMAMYNSAGGSQVSSHTIRAGEKFTAPANPTREGYTFAGWYLGDVLYDFDSLVTGDVKLTAHWTINKYTVTFDVDGGVPLDAVTQDYNTNCPLPTPEKWGFDFAGWFNGTEEVTSLKITGDITLKAHWTAWAAWDDEGEVQITDMRINTDEVKKEYKIGEQFSGEGIKVSLKAVTAEGEVANFDVGAEDLANIVVDYSEFNPSKEGEYTIYVSYTHSGITRHANYQVKVVSVISGVHGIELVKETTEYDIAVGQDPTQIPLNDLKVYLANEDGSRGEEVEAAKVSYKYYLGNAEITAEQLTNENARVFQIWASVDYTVGTETYKMTSFVLVRINGNNIVEMELVEDGAITSQPQSYADSMSTTWKFNVQYRLNQTAVIDLSTAQKGTGDGQYTLENFSPSTLGQGVAVLTYHYAVGTEIWEYEVEVPYSVTPATADSEFHALLDFGKADVAGATQVIPGDIKDGDELVPFMVYSFGAPGYNKQGKPDMEGNNQLEGRIQLGSSKGLTLHLAGPATIAVTAYRGGSYNAKLRLCEADGKTVIWESTEEFTDKDHYKTMTVKVDKAGVYVLLATQSANTFSVDITGKIVGIKSSTDLTSVEAKSYAEDSNVALGSDTFTLMGGSSVAVSDLDETVTVAGKEFNKIIKLGGSKKSNVQSTVKIEITAEMVANGEVTILVYAVSSSTSSARPLALFTGENGATEVSRVDVSTAALLTYTVKTAGTYYIGSANSGINLYGISLVYEGGNN